MRRSVWPAWLLILSLFACHAPAVQQHTVEIVQMRFVPAALTVHKGDQVTFVNHDMVQHNVTDSIGKSLIDTLPAGVSKTITISESFNYYCSMHPVMKGSIVVD